MLVEHGARIEDNDIEGVRPVDLHPVSLITLFYFRLPFRTKQCRT